MELIKVRYSYPGGEGSTGFSLGPVDLCFYPGQLVFLTGGNGSGKTTLAKLITGLYSPDSGKLLLNGKLITNSNREWYRQHMSAVFQDFYLFSTLMGINNDRLDTEGEKYLRWLNLDSKVTIKEDKFSTTDLSHGQGKRLALLITLLEDRPIYVFDEWAADQDSKSRHIFYNEILKTLRQQGKSVVIVSHDDRYFSLADRVVKLEFGKIVSDRIAQNEKKAVRFKNS